MWEGARKSRRFRTTNTQVTDIGFVAIIGVKHGKED